MKNFLNIKQIVFILFVSFNIYVLSFSSQKPNEFSKCTNPECHSNLIDNKVIHSPIADGCEACHKKTGTQHPFTIGNEFSLIDKMPNLCYSCHDSQSNKKVIHVHLKTGNCAVCHEVNSNFWKKFEGL